MDYGKSPVPRSPHFETIMKKYDAVGKFISVRKFYRDCVETMDNNITLRMWQGFMNKWQVSVNERAEKVIAVSEKKELTEMQLEQRSIQKILQIADASLDDLISNPEILQAIPIKERMGWLMSAMKARDSRMNVLIKKKSEDRKQTMYEDIMKGAQYGEILEDDFGEEQPITPPCKGGENGENTPLTTLPAISGTSKRGDNEVKFIPDDL